MSKPLLLTTFILVILLSSCADKTIITHYDTGEKESEYQYTGDSLKHGYYNRYTAGGVMLEESNYVEGKLDGVRKLYNIKGVIESTEIYTLDVLNGPYNVFHSNGNVRIEGIYTNNVLSGLVKVYYPSGKIMEEVQFEDNVEDGPFKEFHENGNLKWEGTYRNGENEFGLLKEYNEEGELIRKMMCDDRAICTTTWTIDGSHLKKKTDKS